MCCRGHLTVNRSKAPEWLVFNPYISGGYRKQSSFWTCVKSIFTLHNETGNMWTHLIAAMYVIYFVYFGYYKLDGHDQFDKLIFLATGIAAFFCFFLSFIYHTFGCYSSKAFDILLHFDYAGIIMLETSMAASSEYFGFCCHHFARNLHMTISITLGVYVTCIVLGPALIKPSERVHKFITDYWNLTFGIFFFYGLVPLIHFGYVSGLSSVRMNNKKDQSFFSENYYKDHEPILSIKIESGKFFWRVLFSFVLLGIGSLIYLFQIPERWLLGKFDLFLNSHQLWHLLTFLGAVHQIQNGLDWQTDGNCNRCPI